MAATVLKLRAWTPQQGFVLLDRVSNSSTAFQVLLFLDGVITECAVDFGYDLHNLNVIQKRTLIAFVQLFGFRHPPADTRFSELIDVQSERMCLRVIYSITDPNAPVSLCNFADELYRVNAICTFSTIGPCGFTTLNRFSKKCWEIKLKSMGNRIPWIRKKQCFQCGKGNDNSVELRLCGGCKVVRFCSRKCQKLSWKQEHGKECKSGGEHMLYFLSQPKEHSVVPHL